MRYHILCVADCMRGLISRVHGVVGNTQASTASSFAPWPTVFFFSFFTVELTIDHVGWSLAILRYLSAIFFFTIPNESLSPTTFPIAQAATDRKNKDALVRLMQPKCSG